jgi:hypothetical protein
MADMHTHATEVDPTDPELYVVNGVTTTRQMSASETVRGWRREIDAGTRLGPRWAIGSSIVDGSPSLWEGFPVSHVAVANPAEGRAAVRQQAAAGADFIKTYSRLSRESFHAIADESRRVGVPFLGHVPDFVQITEASDAGLPTWYCSTPTRCSTSRTPPGSTASSSVAASSTRRPAGACWPTSGPPCGASHRPA